MLHILHNNSVLSRLLKWSACVRASKSGNVNEMNQWIVFPEGLKVKQKQRQFDSKRERRSDPTKHNLSGSEKTLEYLKIVLNSHSITLSPTKRKVFVLKN